MSLELRQLHPLFAAEANGVDLARPVDAAMVEAIWQAIDRYAVLVFRDQRLDDTQLRDFAARFGPLEIGRSAASGGRRRLKHPEIGDISNLDEDGRLRALDDRRRLDSLGNRLWHTDASYMPVPVVLGMLHAVAVPPPSALGGGETEFADMRAAYDALAPAMRAGDRRARRRARHLLVARPDRLYRIRRPASARNTRRRGSGWCAAIPARGARRVYLSAHASHIVGWPVADGRILLYDLNLIATRPEFVYSHQWRIGDLVIWDNRSTMHRGRPHDDSHPRDLRRATTLDTGSTLDEAA